MAASLCWSCHAPVMWAWQWIMAAAFFFFLPIFLSALFGRPLAATIDPRVELMTKMTNPWGVRVREIKRKMEGKRPKPGATVRPPHPLCGGSFFFWVFFFAHHGEMPHLCSTRPSFSFLFFVRVNQELLARPWHGARGADRWCRPDSAARPPTRQELSARAAEDPGPCRERDPELALTAAPITGAELIAPLLGQVGGGGDWVGVGCGWVGGKDRREIACIYLHFIRSQKSILRPPMGEYVFPLSSNCHGGVRRPKHITLSVIRGRRENWVRGLLLQEMNSHHGTFGNMSSAAAGLQGSTWKALRSLQIE